MRADLSEDGATVHSRTARVLWDVLESIVSVNVTVRMATTVTKRLGFVVMVVVMFIGLEITAKTVLMVILDMPVSQSVIVILPRRCVTKQLDIVNPVAHLVGKDPTVRQNVQTAVMASTAISTATAEQTERCAIRHLANANRAASLDMPETTV